MTRDASFGLNRCMLENEWALLIRMTLNTSRIGTCCQASLFQFETAVGVMAIAALHRPFKNLVMERQIKLVLHFAVAAQAKLGFANFEQLES